jgi:hypothetical protein
MTIMRPPQQGHGWESVLGSLSSLASWFGWHGFGGMASSSRARDVVDARGAGEQAVVRPADGNI